MSKPGSVASSLSSDKRKMVVSPVSKSVKFLKSKTPTSEKKKFAKTPHSSKTPKLLEESPNLLKKKRKLSFNNADESNGDISSPAVTTRSQAKKIKTPTLEEKKVKKSAESKITDGSGKANKNRKLSLNEISSSSDHDSNDNASAVAKKVATPKKTLGKRKVDTLNESIGNKEKNDISLSKKQKKGKFSHPAVSSENSEETVIGSATLTKSTKKQKIAKKQESKQAQLTESEKLQSKQKRTIFVGNLPITYTKEKLAKLFNKFGKVESTRLRCLVLDPTAKNRKQGAILKKYGSAASNASGYVKFYKEEDAIKALELNGRLVDDHHIRVDSADPSLKKAVDKNRGIFLRNLNFKLTEDELWKAFEKCGRVDSVRIIKDNRTFLGRGLGYVNFTSPDAVELALKMNDTEIKGRPVKVHRCSDPYVKSSDKIKKQNKLQEKVKKKKQVLKNESDKDFSGKKAELKKKKSVKPSGAVRKKKKISKILSSKA